MARLLLATLAVLMAALITGWAPLSVIAYTLGGILISALALASLSLRGVRLSRDVPTHRGQVGQTFTERLTLENSSTLSKLWIEVQDQSTLPEHQVSRVTGLRGRQRHEWRIDTPLQHRGRFRLGPLRLRASDPFGLLTVSRTVSDMAELIVYPSTVPLPDNLSLNGELPGGSVSQGRSPTTTTQVAGIRDYVPGDSFNRISWPTTARTGRLMVKEFEHDPGADVWLVVDLEENVHASLPPARPHGVSGNTEPWRDSTEEFCITVAASLGEHFLAKKRAVGLLATGKHHEVIATDRGARQVVKLHEALAVIRAEGQQPLGELLTAEASRFSRHTALMIVTPSTDEAWLPALMTVIQSGVRATVVLVDPSTFGSSATPLMLVSQLTALNVPTLVLRRTDDVGAVLAQVATPLARPAWRRRGR